MKKVIKILFIVSLVAISILYSKNVSAEVRYGTIKLYVEGKEITGTMSSTVAYTNIYGKEDTYDVTSPTYGTTGEEGIKFKIYANENIVDANNNIISAKGELVDTIVTSADGIAQTRQLPLGTYKVVDVTSYDDGTENINSVYIVISDPKDYLIMLEKGNGINPTSKVTINIEEFSSVHGDAIYGIFAKNAIKTFDGSTCIKENECVGIAIFDEDNLTYNIDLPKGQYYIKQIQVPHPYELSENEINFEIDMKNISFFIDLEPLTIDYRTLYIIPVYYQYEEEKNEKIHEIMAGLSAEEIEEYLKMEGEQFPNITYKIYTDENKQNLFTTVDASNERVLTLDRMYKGYYYVETFGTEEYENIYRFDKIEEFSITDADGDKYIFQGIQIPEIEYPPFPYIELDYYYDDGTLKTEYAQGELIKENGSIPWPMPNMEFEIKDSEGLLYLHTISDEEGNTWIPYDIFKNAPETLYITILNAPYEINVKPNSPFTFKYGVDRSIKIPIEVNKKYGLKGDLDFNGVIDANDASLLLETYKSENWSSADLPIADMDNNNVIDANDASLILEYYKTH